MDLVVETSELFRLSNHSSTQVKRGVEVTETGMVAFDHGRRSEGVQQNFKTTDDRQRFAFVRRIMLSGGRQLFYSFRTK